MAVREGRGSRPRSEVSWGLPFRKTIPSLRVSTFEQRCWRVTRCVTRLPSPPLSPTPHHPLFTHAGVSRRGGAESLPRRSGGCDSAAQEQARANATTTAPQPKRSRSASCSVGAANQPALHLIACHRLCSQYALHLPPIVFPVRVVCVCVQFSCVVYAYGNMIFSVSQLHTSVLP